MAEDYKLPYSGADIYRRLRDVDTKASIEVVTTDEYEALDEVNANILYMVTDADEEGSSLPSFTHEDEGKFLRVVDGAPAWATIPNAEEATF